MYEEICSIISIDGYEIMHHTYRIISILHTHISTLLSPLGIMVDGKMNPLNFIVTSNLPLIKSGYTCGPGGMLKTLFFNAAGSRLDNLLANPSDIAAYDVDGIDDEIAVAVAIVDARFI